MVVSILLLHFVACPNTFCFSPSFFRCNRMGVKNKSMRESSVPLSSTVHPDTQSHDGHTKQQQNSFIFFLVSCPLVLSVRLHEEETSTRACSCSLWANKQGNKTSTITNQNGNTHHSSMGYEARGERKILAMDD